MSGSKTESNSGRADARTAPTNGVVDIGTLYRQYAGSVLRRARRFFREDEAEEVTHEVFMRAMDKLDSFRQAASPMTWLYRLTTNYCLNRVRDQGRRRELLAENSTFLRRQQVQSHQGETSLFLEQLWRTLDPEIAQIGIYYFVDGMTHDQIAGVVGCAPRTVGFRLDKLKQQALALRPAQGSEG